MPLFIHDCAQCRFLGSDDTHDHYVCGKTLIARYSSDPPDFLSTDIDIARHYSDPRPLRRTFNFLTRSKRTAPR